MATADSVRTDVANQEPKKDLRTLIEQSALELSRALPEGMRPERLVRIALTCLRTTPRLAICTQESFLGALFTAAQIGIEPIAGRAYILPYTNKRKKPDGTWGSYNEAQFMLGYKGVAELFYRHEKAVMLAWGVVKEKDEFSYEYGTEAYIKHVPALGDRGANKAYWVMATLSNGGKSFMVMSHDECMAHGRQHSKTFDTRADKFFDSSPWSKTPESMCLKTVLIQLAKILPLSSETHRAIEQDETSREYKGGIKDALDIPVTTNWDSESEEPEAIGETVVANKPTDIPFGR